MANVAGFDIPIPDIGISMGTITLLVAIVFFTAIIGVVIYVLFMMKLYNRKIVVFENVSGQGFQVVYKDSARLIKLGDGGEELLYLRKKKVHRTAYGRKMGKNTYWFAVGQDGYWYNVVLGDVDAKMGMLDIEPIDRDMRYMHVAVRKNITDRYRKEKWMDKYGSWVFGGITMLLLLGGMWFLIDKMAGIAESLQAAVQTGKAVMEASANVLSGLNNVCGGAGLG